MSTKDARTVLREARSRLCSHGVLPFLCNDCTTPTEGTA